jgi:hypothetical protein
MLRDYVSTLERESIAWVDSIDRHPLLGRIIRGDASREEYVRFLAGTYHYVLCSGPLLAETAEGLRRSGRYPWLVAIVDEKTAEESQHDRWALDDLERCGGSAALAQVSATPLAVHAYVHWSRTMAGEGSPAYLGAAFTLELISMRRAKMAADNLRARKAIPNVDNAVSFLEGHGEADIDHITRLSDVLRRIDDPWDQAAILRAASIVRTLYPRFFQSVETAPSPWRILRQGVAAAIASTA